MRLSCTSWVSAKSEGHISLKCKFNMKKQFYCNQEMFDKTNMLLFKDFNHKEKVNYCKLILTGDIEINPGPTFNNIFAVG